MRYHLPLPAMHADALHQGYHTELEEFRLAFSRGGACTAIVLVLLGIGLDYGQYPGMQIPFALVRAMVCLMIAGIVVVLHGKVGRRLMPWLTMGWLLLPQAMIAWMIWRTDGVLSPYYVGLNLAIFASGIALPFGLWQNLIFGALSCGLYILACLMHPRGLVPAGTLVVNMLFLMFAACASAVYTYFNEQARFTLFRLKAEVMEKNSALGVINRQLTEIKGQLLQQEKMAAIGTLAAGLMHEVNNPVNYCLMAIDIAMEQPVTSHEPMLLECLQDAREGMQRIQHIVSDLKTFAYRKPEASEEADQGAPFLLEKALDAVLRLTAHELRGVNIVRELPADTLVVGNDAAIIGVMINLLSNAALSMRKGGAAEPTIHVSARLDGRRLRVTVQDNGPGIAPQHLARVFEPFFTTRDVGQGLGLGLSISYAVIERHGGVLFAESELGHWARFSFDLPRAD